MGFLLLQLFTHIWSLHHNWSKPASCMYSSRFLWLLWQGAGDVRVEESDLGYRRGSGLGHRRCRSVMTLQLDQLGACWSGLIFKWSKILCPTQKVSTLSLFMAGVRNLFWILWPSEKQVGDHTREKKKKTLKKPQPSLMWPPIETTHSPGAPAPWCGEGQEGLRLKVSGQIYSSGDPGSLDFGDPLGTGVEPKIRGLLGRTDRPVSAIETGVQDLRGRYGTGASWE